MRGGEVLLPFSPIGGSPPRRGFIDLNRRRQRLVGAYTESTESEADHVGFS